MALLQAPVPGCVSDLQLLADVVKPLLHCLPGLTQFLSHQHWAYQLVHHCIILQIIHLLVCVAWGLCVGGVGVGGWGGWCGWVGVGGGGGTFSYMMGHACAF